jgi:hypothetical protein
LEVFIGMTILLTSPAGSVNLSREFTQRRPVSCEASGTAHRQFRALKLFSQGYDETSCVGVTLRPSPLRSSGNVNARPVQDKIHSSHAGVIWHAQSFPPSLGFTASSLSSPHPPHVLCRVSVSLFSPLPTHFVSISLEDYPSVAYKGDKLEWSPVNINQKKHRSLNSAEPAGRHNPSRCGFSRGGRLCLVVASYLKAQTMVVEAQGAFRIPYRYPVDGGGSLS